MRLSISIDFPPIVKARYSHPNDPHPNLMERFDTERSKYANTLESFFDFSDQLKIIPDENPGDGKTPFFRNSMFSGMDAVSLYSFVCKRNPRSIVEIGSGNSTKFLRRAIDDRDLETQLISIDPQPRQEIDELTNIIFRSRLEDIDLKVFEDLGDNDIVVFDGSHRCFQNSDVTVFFLEILPSLKPGVLVYIDDIYLPYDYPPDWGDRWYSEQYILATLLLADGGRRYDIVLPLTYVKSDQYLSQIEEKFWHSVGREPHSGNGFWLQVL